LVKAPYLDGGTALWSGEVRPFLSPADTCYGCTLSTKERSISDVPWSCVDVVEDVAVGATIAISTLVAGWMSLIAIRFLMGLPYPEGFLQIDGIQGTIRKTQPQRDPHCPLHQPIEQAIPIPVNCHDSVGQLRWVLGTHKVPLAWEAVQERVTCERCGFSEMRWGVPRQERCPQCGYELTPHTTLELIHTPEDLMLSTLGIPPREILAVRSATGIEWVELAVTS
jgi:hypothetical protein